jgi:lysophospholipase L1-like esterase
VVTFGDSITEGAGSTYDADHRYPDALAERLRAAGRPMGVLNEGIGGNRVLTDSQWFGERGVARFWRDALAWSNVRTVIVLEGINDIGMSGWSNPLAVPRRDVSAAQIIAGYRSMIRQAHLRGVKIIGATILPFKGAGDGYYTEAGEKKRDQVNRWIRTSGAFDAVIDFEKAMADPKDPDAINPAYGSGDHLHPNDAGYRAMAAAVDIDEL